MKNVRKAICAAMAATLLLGAGVAGAGCFGPFRLSKRLHKWNGRVSEDRWGKEIIFFTLCAIGVYPVCLTIDALVFNSIEFWTGNNPLEGNDKEKSEAPRKLTNGDEVIALAPSPEGNAVAIERFRAGSPAGSVRIESCGDLAVATDGSGRTLYTATRTPEGGRIVTDASGRTVAEYSAAEIQGRLAVGK